MNNLNALEIAMGITDLDDTPREPLFEVDKAPTREISVVVDAQKIEQDKLDDYEFSRNTMIHLIEQGNTALEGLLKMAAMADTPQAFDTIAKLIKTLAETTKDLSTISGTIKEKSSQKAESITNNQFNVSSQKDIIELLNNKNKDVIVPK